jgi:peptidoglycan/LPS O-acetylase OafA/YrhL
MKTDRSNAAALVGGTLLIAFGLLSLAGQLFRNFVVWSYIWPFIVIIFGGLFFAGMFLGGKQVSGLAIPGSIISGIGLLFLYQTLTNHWESWSYGWTVIIFFVGIGIYLAGVYGGNERQKVAGTKVMRIGFILFVIFGAFFEMTFSINGSLGVRGLVFPALMILLGGYLIIKRLNLVGERKSNGDKPSPSEPPISQK